jgi:hypothetical protein
MKTEIVDNEKGFILVWALLLLVVVMILGVSGISTSIFETKMAANEALHTQAFYQADGGTENGIALLKHNITCISGFSGSGPVLDGDIKVKGGSENFWLTNNSNSVVPMASNTNWDFYYPAASNQVGIHTNGRINGSTKLVAGSSLTQLAGYEGKGKSIGADGAFLVYDIKVERVGERNSRSAICTSYRVGNQFASNPAQNCVY